MPSSPTGQRDSVPVSPTGRRVDSVSPGGRKVDPRPYYQWLFDRRRSGELSPLASHFPPQPWPPSPSMVRTASAPADLHMGQPSPTGVGSVLLSPLSDAASFLAKAADLSLKRKDVGHTLHCCNQAVSLGPDCGPAWRHRACARLQAGQAEAAVEDASAAVLAEPLNVHSWETRTAAKFGSGDYDGAVEDAAHAISLDAWRPSLWRRRALASVMLQQIRQQPAVATARHTIPYQLPDRHLLVPEVPVALDRAALLSNVCQARKTAALGPSGRTAESIRLVLDDEEAASLPVMSPSSPRLVFPSRPLLPCQLVAWLRTRGCVVEDFLRCLVARALAQPFASHFQAACNPHQYALSSRAGAKALVHTLQARTQADAHLTVVSVDATAAYDLFSRESEGGEHGDPLMPAIFSVALAPALHDLQREPSPTEQVLAYFDDVYILASPDRVALLYRRLADLIWQRARLRLNASTTRVWNAADVVPQLAPDSAVWVGDPALIPEQRGLVALGVTLGSPAFIGSDLQQSLPPEATRAFATAHDDAVLT
ncbi:hypothetical protein AK812_SmicGene42397, partial [Symbiodinium microadriaticum]